MSSRFNILIFFVSILFIRCDPGFEEPQVVLDLRVLAARCEPPEITFPITDTPSSGASVGSKNSLDSGKNKKQPIDYDKMFESVKGMTFGPFKLDFLVVDPTLLDSQLDYSLNVCALSSQGLCKNDENNTVVATGKIKSNVLELNVKITGDQLVAAQKNDPYFGYFGIPVWTQLTVKNNTNTVYATKSIVITPVFDSVSPHRTANKNPEIMEIQDVTDMKDVKIVQKVGPPIPEDGSWSVQTGQKITLLIIPSEQSHEHFYMPTFKGTEVEDDEKLTFYYLSDKGHFSMYGKKEKDSFHTFVAAAPKEYVKDLSSTWEAPNEQGIAHLWFIIIDNRGGTDFKTVTVNVKKH